MSEVLNLVKKGLENLQSEALNQARQIEILEKELIDREATLEKTLARVEDFKVAVAKLEKVENNASKSKKTKS